MASKQQIGTDQAALWNGAAGMAWVDEQRLIEAVLAPFADRLVAAVRAEGAKQVLDIGCGTGSTTLETAGNLGAGGRATGIDISKVMIEAARARAERERMPAEFIHDDAQTHGFEPARFDMIISRFGVMFFDDPVAAFANLRAAAQDGAALRFFAWRSAADNPFMLTAERAAGPYVPNLPPRLPDAPGQLAFADPERVREILAKSGWQAIDIRPVDVECSFPESELVTYFTRFGPLGLALADADEERRKAVVDAVRPAFDPFISDGTVRFVAACWEMAARR
jgi:SAM-dependent methyltransferase